MTNPLIKVTTADGRIVYINVNHIVSLQPVKMGDFNYWEILLSSEGSTYIVEQLPDEVSGLISKI